MEGDRERADELEGEIAALVVAREPSGRPAARHRPHAPWGDVMLLGALTALGSVAMDMYLPALPTLTRALHATPASGQATIALFLTGLALGQLIYGPLSDRYGRRWPALIGIVLYAAASAGCFLAPDMGTMTVARVLQALGACGGQVIARAVVRDRYDDHEVIHVFALLSLVFGVAPVIAPFAGGLVLTFAGWRWIFGVQLLFSLGLFAWVLSALKESRSEATRLKAVNGSVFGAYGALLRQPRLRGYLATSAFAGAGLFAYINAAPEVVITFFGVPAALFGWVFGSNAIGMMSANQVNARLTRILPGRTIVRVSLWAALAIASVMAACAWTKVGGLWGVLPPLFGVLTALSFTQPNVSAGAMTVDRERAGATAALLGIGFFGVGSLAGLATARLHDGTAWPMAVVVLGAVALSYLSFELSVGRERLTS